MPQLFTNNASGLLAAQITASATSCTLQSTQGDSFPTPTGGDFFIATLEDDLGAIEIVKCTSRAGDIMTIARAQEGTSSQTFSAGSRFELRLTKGTLQNFFQTLGGNITGDVNLNGNKLDNVIIGGNSSITGDEIYGTVIRGAQGVSGNQIEVPANGVSDPTIGGNAIYHVGNLTLGNYAAASHTHPATQIVDGTFNDLLVKESNVTQHRKAVSRVFTNEYTTDTRDFNSNDIGNKARYTGVINATWSLPQGLGETGDIIIVSKAVGTGVSLRVRPHGGVTFYRRDGVGAVDITTQYAQVGLHCISTDVWELSGDYDNI